MAKYRILVLLFAFTGCTTTQSELGPRSALPTESELKSYVQAHWSDWSKRFARFTSRRGETTELISVENANCEFAYVTPQCRVGITGRFEDGSVKMQRMFAQFDRNQSGELEEVIVMYHRRKK